MAKKSDVLGADGYRRGALERIEEALRLLRAEFFAGSVYLAGRAVEGMLRAIIWKKDSQIQQGKKSLEAGHDLRELLILVRGQGLLGSEKDQELHVSIHRASRLWFNNMRFVSSQYVERYWRRIGQVHKHRSFKQASADFFESCAAIIKRCEELYARGK